ncbi:hypothetical protein N9D38_10790, partial [Rubripirellula sp.]|nr:hypothetical protein [Rubripirellula sp.]
RQFEQGRSVPAWRCIGGNLPCLICFLVARRAAKSVPNPVFCLRVNRCNQPLHLGHDFDRAKPVSHNHDFYWPKIDWQRNHFTAYVVSAKRGFP